MPYGLASYGFTNRADYFDLMVDEVEAGNLSINTLEASLPETAFGGVYFFFDVFVCVVVCFFHFFICVVYTFVISLSVHNSVFLVLACFLILFICDLCGVF